MRIPSCVLLLALLVASAPAADAQLGRLVDRARAAVVDRSADGAEPVATRTGPPPAMDLGGLLDTHFYHERGEFRFSDPGRHFLLFPPSGFVAMDAGARYVVRDANGQVVGEDGMSGSVSSDAEPILRVRARGGSATISESGAYTFEVMIGSETIASIPFTASVGQSDDPFATGTQTTVDGPWRTHGYFEHLIEEPSDPMSFSTWIRQDEPPGQHPSEVSIRRDGQEVAWGTGGFAGGSYQLWARADFDLLTPDSRDGSFARVNNDRHYWTIGDVTPGTYEVVLSTESGGEFRRFTVEGAAGAFVPHSRSDVAVEPRSQFLTPRKVGGQMRNKPVQVYWVGPASM